MITQHSRTIVMARPNTSRRDVPRRIARQRLLVELSRPARCIVAWGHVRARLPSIIARTMNRSDSTTFINYRILAHSKSTIPSLKFTVRLSVAKAQRQIIHHDIMIIS
jgi:uncharacterized protein (UPF0548 family)